MKYAINDQIVLLRAPEGPLSAYIGAFAAFLSAQGYALKSIHRQVHLAACSKVSPRILPVQRSKKGAVANSHATLVWSASGVKN